MQHDINIYATLKTAPTQGNTHELVCLTRGASAELVYTLFDKVIAPSDIDQVTFAFKQNRKVFWYTMFTYVVESADTEVDIKKDYYIAKPIEENSYQCTLEKVENPTGSPKASNYVEISQDPTLSWKKNLHTIDPHFYLLANDEYDSITFSFSPEETKQFRANVDIEYEVILRLNTDQLENFNYKDSTIIEPQHPIVVFDSIYSRI